MLKKHQQQSRCRIRFCYHQRHEYAPGEVFSRPVTLLEIPRRDWDFFRLCFFPEVTSNLALVTAEPQVNFLLYARYRVSPDGLLLLHRGKMPGGPKARQGHEPPGVVTYLGSRVRELVAAAAEFN